MDDFIPSIKVKFFITGDDFDLDEVTNRVGINPTRARTKDSFPPQTIQAGFACNEWLIETTEENCLAVAIKFEEMLSMLKGKTENIKSLCDDYNLETGFVIVIHMVGEDNPEMILPREVISFAASMNADIAFDMYVYCDGEPLLD